MSTVEFKFKNGDKVQDKISKEESIILTRSEFLGGQKAYLCEPEVIKGRIPYGILGRDTNREWIREERLELVIENFLGI